MNDKRRKFFIRLMCIILAGLMVLGGGIAVLSRLIGF